MAATIKTFPNGSIVLKNGLVSCSCCCNCQIFNTEVLLNYSKNDHFTKMKSSVEISQDGLSFFSVGGNDYQSQNMGFRGFDYIFSSSGSIGQLRPTTGRPQWLVRKPACLRWLCRCVTVSEGGLRVGQQQEYGGPSINNLNFWEDVVRPRWGDETESGTFLYIIIFLGLFRRRRTVGGPPENSEDYPSTMYWEPRDDEAYIMKERITKI